ncbi:MAG: hypothetical protein ACLTSL_00915 [Odoribacter splanchnicus]
MMCRLAVVLVYNNKSANKNLSNGVLVWMSRTWVMQISGTMHSPTNVAICQYQIMND